MEGKSVTAVSCHVHGQRLQMISSSILSDHVTLIHTSFLWEVWIESLWSREEWNGCYCHGEATADKCSEHLSFSSSVLRHCQASCFLHQSRIIRREHETADNILDGGLMPLRCNCHEIDSLSNRAVTRGMSHGSRVMTGMPRALICRSSWMHAVLLPGELPWSGGGHGS